jgi:hypothetical protein
VALSIIPIGFETFRHRRESKAAQAAVEPAS